jgi:hypothetical protein
VSSASTSNTPPSGSVLAGTEVRTSAQTATGSPNNTRTKSMSCASWALR